MESTQSFMNVGVTCWGSYYQNIRTYTAWYQGIIFPCSTQNRISLKKTFHPSHLNRMEKATDISNLYTRSTFNVDIRYPLNKTFNYYRPQGVRLQHEPSHLRINSVLPLRNLYLPTSFCYLQSLFWRKSPCKITDAGNQVYFLAKYNDIVLKFCIKFCDIIS